MIDRKSVILITGATGMVGSTLFRLLRRKGFNNVLTPRRCDLDLLNRKNVDAYFSEFHPDHVFMVAAKVGGIEANIADPVGFLSENIRMEINLFEACYKYKTHKNIFFRKFLYLSSMLFPADEGRSTSYRAGGTYERRIRAC